MHPFRNFLTVLPPPAYKSWNSGLREGLGMRELENIPGMQSVPRRLSMIVTLERLVANYGQLLPSKSLPFLNQELMLHDIISLHAKRRKTFFYGLCKFTRHRTRYARITLANPNLGITKCDI